MKLAYLLAAVAAVNAAASSEITFSQFAARFGKRYKSLEEFALRSQKYAANWAMITAHNANPDATFKMAINAFGDLTAAEFVTRFATGHRYVGPAKDIWDRVIRRHSASNTPTPSATAPAASASGTGTGTPPPAAISASPSSAGASASTSSLPSTSAAATRPATASTTRTPQAASQTPTSTASTAAAPSMSAASTPSTTTSASASVSPSTTGTPSPTTSVAASASPSASVTGTTTGTPSSGPSAPSTPSSTGSRTGTATGTATGTRTPTASPSRAPANTGATVDWVAAGAVTRVKDQGQCGSCWAFAATGVLESAAKIAGAALQELSEQELLDCSSPYGNMGCSGGHMENAFRYVVASGISAGAAYPYTGAVGPCQAGTRARVVRAKSFTEVASYSDAALMTAVARQPVAVAVAADSSCFQFYSSGVLNCPSCGVGLNHAVLLVGYGVDPATGLAYYRIRNQWGTYWGDNGFMKLIRGPAAGSAGMCGILMDSSFASV